MFSTSVSEEDIYLLCGYEEWIKLYSLHKLRCWACYAYIALGAQWKCVMF